MLGFPGCFLEFSASKPFFNRVMADSKASCFFSSENRGRNTRALPCQILAGGFKTHPVPQGSKIGHPNDPMCHSQPRSQPRWRQLNNSVSAASRSRRIGSRSKAGFRVKKFETGFAPGVEIKFQFSISAFCLLRGEAHFGDVKLAEGIHDVHHDLIIHFVRAFHHHAQIGIVRLELL